MSSTEPPGWANPGPGYGPPPRYGVNPGAATAPWPGVPAPAPAGRGSGTTVLAIVAIVLSGVAVLAAVLAMITVGRPLVSGGYGYEDEDEVYVYSLAGKLAERSAGSGAAAAELQTSLTQVLEDDYSDVESLSCPDTPKVAQGVVTPCRADVDGEDRNLVVIFNDSSGHYTALVS